MTSARRATRAEEHDVGMGKAFAVYGDAERHCDERAGEGSDGQAVGPPKLGGESREDQDVDGPSGACSQGQQDSQQVDPPGEGNSGSSGDAQAGQGRPGEVGRAATAGEGDREGSEELQGDRYAEREPVDGGVEAQVVHGHAPGRPRQRGPRLGGTGGGGRGGRSPAARSIRTRVARRPRRGCRREGSSRWRRWRRLGARAPR